MHVSALIDGYSTGLNWRFPVLRLQSSKMQGQFGGDHHPMADRKAAPKQFSQLSDRAITMGELKEHNSRSNMWFAIRGNVYDLTDFASRHPGGIDILLICAGRDMTQLFEATHGRAQEIQLK